MPTPPKKTTRAVPAGGKIEFSLSEPQARFISSKALYTAMVGGRGCLAPEMPISGMPIGDLTAPVKVETLWGPTIASRGYLKGEADLYAMTTTLGATAVVTLDHRFLTLLGWQPLRNLRVGSIIAADSLPKDDGQGTLPSPLQVSLQSAPAQPDEPIASSSSWTEITAISFLRHGEFYDLSVPGAQHYSSNGLWHHNSGKSFAGTLRAILYMMQNPVA